MSSDGQRTYRIHEFAALTGVSVRALHHYDRLGLLKPRRAASGYRLYVDSDAAVLEQIVALKFIGVPLRDVKRLLRTATGEFKKVLAAQRTLLEEKRRRLDLAIAAIRQAQEADKATAGRRQQIRCPRSTPIDAFFPHLGLAPVQHDGPVCWSGIWGAAMARIWRAACHFGAVLPIHSRESRCPCQIGPFHGI